MSRYDRARSETGFGVPVAGLRHDWDDVGRFLGLARDPEPRARQVAAKNLCTCHVRSEDDRVWATLLDLFADGDPRVRRDALHALTDSTPAGRVEAVVAALEARYDDADPSLRRRIRRTLTHYRRTGRLTDAPR